MERFESPALIGVARLLKAFDDNDWDNWYTSIAPTMLSLALICRAQAYESSELNSIQLPIAESDIPALLVDSYDACPQLLLWALRWVELCFHHLHTPTQLFS